MRENLILIQLVFLIHSTSIPIRLLLMTHKFYAKEVLFVIFVFCIFMLHYRS